MGAKRVAQIVVSLGIIIWFWSNDPILENLGAVLFWAGLIFAFLSGFNIFAQRVSPKGVCALCNNEYFWNKNKFLRDEYNELYIQEAYDGVLSGDDFRHLGFLIQAMHSPKEKNKIYIGRESWYKDAKVELCESCEIYYFAYKVAENLNPNHDSSDLQDQLLDELLPKSFASALSTRSFKQESWKVFFKLNKIDFSDIINTKDKLVKDMDQRLDHLIDDARDEMIGISNFVDTRDNLSTKIVDLLEESNLKMSGEEINKRLNFISPDVVKDICEDLYIGGHIKRDGNHRYSSLTEGNDDPVKNSGGYIAEIKELAKLKDAGLITPDEFEEKKSQLLK